jgi:putative ABC transport system substrate-binding protein
MRRREFITLVGGAAAAWPLAARAQQSGMPIIGYLSAGLPDFAGRSFAGFLKGLSETGYVETHTLKIEYRWAEGQASRLPDLVADLVRQRVAVIVTPSSTAAALAAKSATTTIPIVFTIGNDPVEVGLIASLNRPGGNVTGLTSMNVELGAKRLGLLRELLPGTARIAALVPRTYVESRIEELRAAASAIGRQIDVFAADSSREIETAFAMLAQDGADALLIAPNALFFNRRIQLGYASGALQNTDDLSRS